jgi:flap endonuclease-1
MGINQKQLVDMAILIGTDFNEGVKGIGPKKSLDLIKKTGDIEKALESIKTTDKPSSDTIQQIQKIFLEPDVTDDYSLKWSVPDNEAVLSILCDGHQFTRERVEPILEKFSIIKNISKQKNLIDF